MRRYAGRRSGLARPLAPAVDERCDARDRDGDAAATQAHSARRFAVGAGASAVRRRHDGVHVRRIRRLETSPLLESRP